MINWVLDKLQSLQNFYLDLRLFGCIIYGIITLFLFWNIVKKLYDECYEFKSLILLVIGEAVIGAPLIVKLVFELGGWEIFYGFALVKYIVYWLLIYIFSIMLIKHYYDDYNNFLALCYMLFCDVMLSLPLIVKLLIKHFSKNDEKKLEISFSGIVEIFDNHPVVKYVTIGIAGTVILTVLLNIFKLIKRKILLKRIISHMYRNADFKSQAELVCFLKSKFNSPSDIKMGAYNLIESCVSALVSRNVNMINSETKTTINKLGMTEYSELKSSLYSKFGRLCVGNLDSAINDAINKSGEIIRLPDKVLVKSPEAMSGETYKRNEIRMD